MMASFPALTFPHCNNNNNNLSPPPHPSLSPLPFGNFNKRRANSKRKPLLSQTCLKITSKRPFPPLLASSEGVPSEILEDSKFVPINEDDPEFGPPVLLLMGFSQKEVPQVLEFLKNMQGDFMKVLLCTKDMIKGSLWDAVNSSQPDIANIQVADGVPRVCFLSGLTGEEILIFVAEFPKAGLEPAVFSALVPNNAGKSIEELTEEIMGDHERLTAKLEHEGDMVEEEADVETNGGSNNLERQ